jgi:Ca2+-binding RTX toxin-like protein
MGMSFGKAGGVLLDIGQTVYRFFFEADALQAACDAYRANPNPESAAAVLAADRDYMTRLVDKWFGVPLSVPAGSGYGEAMTKIIEGPEASDIEKLNRIMQEQDARRQGPSWREPLADSACNARFGEAQRSVPVRRDPLTLDLDGDGIETVAGSGSNPIVFDHDGDGLKTGTGWIKGDDGFLVMDRNGNGTIDNGTELFGDATNLYAGGKAADGFAALVQEDTNGDGKVSSLDARWNSLRVWRDLNQNGVSEAGELFTLQSLNIASIATAKTANAQTLPDGNQIADLGSFTRTDGSAGTLGEVNKLGDVNLATDTFHREFTDNVALADGVASLPDMQGSGLVRDLREAMSQSESLRSIVAQFAAAPTRAEQMALVDQLLGAWADTSGLASTLEARGLAAGGTIGATAYRIRYMAFGDVSRTAHMVTLPLGDGYSASDLDGTSFLRPDDVANPMLDEAYRSLISQWSAKIHTLEAFNGRYFFGLPGEDEGAGTDGAHALTGQRISTTNPNHYNAAGGVGTILITYTQDQLNLLQQSYDALRESVYGALAAQTRLQSYLDLAQLTIDAEGVRFDFAPVEAAFQAKATTDLKNALYDVIEFERTFESSLHSAGWSSVGVLRSLVERAAGNPELEAVLAEMHVKIGSGSLQGTGVDDTLVGQSGNDSLLGGVGADTLTGGAGNDSLYGDGTYGGNGGNDVLDGGAGNDTLVGGFGSDTYLFGRGDGQDTLDNDSDGWNGTADPTVGKQDVLQFKAGVLPGDVTLVRSGDSLVVRINGSTDQVTVTRYFSGDGVSARAFAVEKIRFEDGTSWDVAAVKPMVLQATAGADTLTGYATADVLSGGAGNDILYGRDGNDALDGGDGADSLYGENGNDVLSGGEGNDSLSDTVGTAYFSGGNGTDTMSGGSSGEVYCGGLGNDTLNTGTGMDVLLYNKGDGSDVIYGAAGTDNTVSLGGGICYQDLKLRKSANDLILEVSASESLTFKNWYVGLANNKTVSTLQVILDASADYDAASSNPLLNKKVEQFDFARLAGAFDQALAANPALSNWALTNALSSYHLNSSDSAALGGDLAYYYGKNGSLAGVNVSSAQDVIGSANLGAANQVLRAFSEISGGASTLS